MPRHTQRYCADPAALAALKRDGMGWGHDVDCGCFHDHGPRSPGIIARTFNLLKRRS